MTDGRNQRGIDQMEENKGDQEKVELHEQRR
jgi:hypothetical protein